MAFTIEIIEEKKNPLINRTELKFRIDHLQEGTPNRLEIKTKIAAIQGSNEKLTIIRNIKSFFGAYHSIGKAYIYGTVDELKLYEPFHIQVRNLPKEKRVEITSLKKKKEPYKHLFEY